MTDRPQPLIVVDAANVVGSRPDGWWRDRHAATERLRDRLAGVAGTGLSGHGPSWARTPPVRVVLVTEGRASGVASIESVTVLPADGTADDAIVALVAEHPDRDVLVVTSDRGLRDRVTAHGASVVGAGALAATSNPHRRR